MHWMTATIACRECAMTVGDLVTEHSKKNLITARRRTSVVAVLSPASSW